MIARRVTALVILGAFLALAVLSFLGDRVLSGVFIVAAGTVLAHHAFALCPRCSNLACAFNPRFVLARTKDALQADDRSGVAFSNLPITRTTVLPLLATGPLAVIAAWRFSPPATAVVAAVALGAHTVFRHLTCARCGNNCAGNCNRSYREWRLTQSRPQS